MNEKKLVKLVFTLIATIIITILIIFYEAGYIPSIQQIQSKLNDVKTEEINISNNNDKKIKPKSNPEEEQIKKPSNLKLVQICVFIYVISIWTLMFIVIIGGYLIDCDDFPY